MAFSASFIITKTADPSTFVITDNSSGSDPDLTGRIIYLYQANGTLLVPAITWPIGQSSYTFTGLEQDVSLNVRVEWSSSNPLPDPSTYTYSQLEAFVKYCQNFLFTLTQKQLANPQLAQDQGWYSNKATVFALLRSAQDAISVGANIADSQFMISLYQVFINQENYFF